MSSLKLIITDTAKEDIKLIAKYIAKTDKQKAREIVVYIHKLCNTLTLFPKLGVARKDFTFKNYRFFVFQKKYIIKYRAMQDAIYISRVLSTYQDICNIL